MPRPASRSCTASGWFVALAVGVLASEQAAGQALFLVKDLDTTVPTGAFTSMGAELVSFGGSLFFSGCNTANGCELWKSDGTSGGTAMLVEINTAAPGGVPSSSNPGKFTIVGATLFFVATTAGEGAELWKTDGTAVGTSLVLDIRSGTTGAGIGEMEAVGSTLYFSANDGTNGTELWTSDGTGVGTVMVVNINATPAVPSGNASSSPSQLTAFGTRLLFFANDGATGFEPWISDGSAPGTDLLGDLRTGLVSSALFFNQPPFALLGGDAFFLARDDSFWGLWKTDGTKVGTVPIYAFGLGGIGDAPISIVTAGAQLLIALVDRTASAAVEDGLLYSSGGTAPTTSFLKSFPLGLQRGAAPISVITEFDGAGYFLADTRNLGTELWTSDGTEVGTVLVKDIWPGAAGIVPGSPRLWRTSIGLLFAPAAPDIGVEPWFSKGTTDGTRLLRDIRPGLFGGGIVLQQATATPAMLGGDIYFAALGAAEQATSLWRTDGTAGGTVEILGGTSTASSGRPGDFARFGSVLLFSGREPLSGREPWISDRTAAGTTVLADLTGDAAGSDPRYFAALGSRALFSATTAATGRELFVTDGTPGGTVLLADIEPGTGSSDPAELVTLGSAVLFRACTFTAGCELWRSDGLPGGTGLVKDLAVGASNGFPEHLVVGAGKVFFRATTPASGTELWVTDGTEANTVLTTEIAAGADSSLPQDIEGTSTRVFFLADDATHGVEVWTSDGTGLGTVMPQDIAAGVDDGVYAGTTDFAAVHGGLFYFRGLDDTGFTSSDIWKSDGTPGGTVKIREMNDFDPSGLGDVAFVASGASFAWFGFFFGNGDWEPFRTDGTSAGTLQVADINPGSGGSNPCCYTPFAGNTFFSASSRLQRSTGFPGGTVALGPAPPAHITPTLVEPPESVAGALFLVGSSTATGAELYAYGFAGALLVTGFEGADLTDWAATVPATP